MKPSTDLDPCWQPLCAAESLQEGGLARSFELLYQGRSCRAFAVRHQGRVQAYLNRCSHVALELDWLPDRFFDATGQYLVCAAHGALFLPDTGACIGAPGRGPLVKIPLLERDAILYWQSGPDCMPAAT